MVLSREVVLSVKELGDAFQVRGNGVILCWLPRTACLLFFPIPFIAACVAQRYCSVSASSPSNIFHELLLLPSVVVITMDA